MSVVFQNHHIFYGDEKLPEWKVNLRRWMHRAVTLLDRMKATPDNYAEMINFQHAVTTIINKKRMELDTQE